MADRKSGPVIIIDPHKGIGEGGHIFARNVGGDPVDLSNIVTEFSVRRVAGRRDEVTVTFTDVEWAE